MVAAIGRTGRQRQRGSGREKKEGDEPRLAMAGRASEAASTGRGTDDFFLPWRSTSSFFFALFFIEWHRPTRQGLGSAEVEEPRLGTD